MNRTWTTLIVIALLMLVGFVGYDFYLSFTGQKSVFDKSVQGLSIPTDLGTQELEYIKSLEGNVPVKSRDLDNK